MNSEGRLNIKVSAYQYRDPHGPATVLSLAWESPYPQKTVSILNRDPERYSHACVIWHMYLIEGKFTNDVVVVYGEQLLIWKRN